MSEFNVLVIGDNPEQQLVAFQSFEGSGIESDKVEEIERTESMLEAFHSPDGCFYRRPDGSFIAVGLANSEDQENGTEVSGKASDLMDIRQFLSACGVPEFAIVGPGETPDLEEKHKFAYAKLDDENNLTFIDRTIPDSKFDEFTLGGRWNNWLKVKKEYADAIEEVEACRKLDTAPSESALEKTKHLVRDEPAKTIQDTIRRMMSGQQDQDADCVCGAPFGAIDIDRMVTSRLDASMKLYDKVQETINGRDWLTPNQIRPKYNSDKEASAAFTEQPVVQDLARERLSTAIHKIQRWDEMKLSRDEYQQKFTAASILPFAIVKSGFWFSVNNGRGRLDDATWGLQVSALLSDVSDDTMVHIYTCKK